MSTHALCRTNVRRWIAEGYGATTPRFLGEVPALFRDGTWPVDVVLLNCSMPDEEGYVSFGVSADLATAATECAKTVIAQLNPHMPFSFGDPVIHVSRLAAAVEVNDPLVEVPTPEPGPTETAIGNAIAEHNPRRGYVANRRRWNPKRGYPRFGQPQTPRPSHRSHDRRGCSH